MSYVYIHHCFLHVFIAHNTTFTVHVNDADWIWFILNTHGVRQCPCLVEFLTRRYQIHLHHFKYVLWISWFVWFGTPLLLPKQCLPHSADLGRQSGADRPLCGAHRRCAEMLMQILNDLTILLMCCHGDMNRSKPGLLWDYTLHNCIHQQFCFCKELDIWEALAGCA